MNAPFYLGYVPPAHCDIVHMKGFETEQQGAMWAAKLLKLCNGRNGNGEPLAMSGCSPATPCGAASCQPCGRQFRRWFVGSAMTMFRQSGDPLVAVTLVHHTLQRPPGELHTFDLDLAKRQLARHVERAGLGDVVGVGGIDFSFNVDATGRWDAHWQPHAYVVFQGADAAAIKNALAPYYPRAVSIPRPVKAVPVRDLMSAVSYAFKSAFFRRTSYVDDSGRRNTSRPQQLKPAQARELLAFLDRHKPTDRVFLRNVRRHGLELVRMAK